MTFERNGPHYCNALKSADSSPYSGIYRPKHELSFACTIQSRCRQGQWNNAMRASAGGCVRASENTCVRARAVPGDPTGLRTRQTAAYFACRAFGRVYVCCSVSESSHKFANSKVVFNIFVTITQPLKRRT